MPDAMHVLHAAGSHEPHFVVGDMACHATLDHVAIDVRVLGVQRAMNELMCELDPGFESENAVELIGPGGLVADQVDREAASPAQVLSLGKVTMGSPQLSLRNLALRHVLKGADEQRSTFDLPDHVGVHLQVLEVPTSGADAKHEIE